VRNAAASRRAREDFAAARRTASPRARSAASPPFAECRTDGGGIAITGDTNTKKLGRSSVAGVITSPPYAESIKGDHKEQETAKESHAARTDPGQGGPLGKSQRFGGYGATAGNIGNLKEGKVGAVVTSPPFAACDTKPTNMAPQSDRLAF
jgi:hypothetical protein